MVGTLEISLISEIYAPSCVSLAVDEYNTAALSVVVASQGERETVVRFCHPSGTAPDDSVVRDFLNRALELSVRATLED